MPEGLGNMLKTAQVAAKIQSRCEKYGWTYEVKRGSILTISKAFTPNDTDALVECDMEYYSILSELPMCRDGSDWGTDCSGVGAIAALKEGCFVMNRSGGNKNILKLLSKSA
jgi:hypothetical protein